MRHLKVKDSWGWRKLFLLRDDVRSHFFHKIGNGCMTSAWYDTWCDIGPLQNLVSFREISKAGFDEKSKVSDIMGVNGWSCPADWFVKFPSMMQIQVPLSIHRPDRLVWRANDGSEGEFSASNVWEAVRERKNVVVWKDVVWYPQCIPRHAFLVWLLIRHCLKTHDRLQAWDVSKKRTHFSCVFCSLQPDSHDHLFFECSYSRQVWSKVCVFANLPKHCRVVCYCYVVATSR